MAAGRYESITVQKHSFCIYPREMKTSIYTKPIKKSSVLFIAGKHWKQPQCLSAGERSNCGSSWNTAQQREGTMDTYNHLRDLQGITLSKKSQAQNWTRIHLCNILEMTKLQRWGID